MVAFGGVVDTVETRSRVFARWKALIGQRHVATGATPGTQPISRVSKSLVAAIAALATTLFTLIGLGSFRGAALGMDLGIFDQAVQAYSRLQTPDIQIKAQGGFNILGDHFSPVIALLAPFYRIWPDARMLMCAQAVLFGFSVGFVGWYAYRRGLGRAAYVVEACFACSFGVLSAAVFDFHEVAFALPVLLWAVWAFLERRDAQMIAACVLMCFIKEDMPMYAAGLALALFFTGRRLFGVILGAASVAATLLLVFVVIPYFSYWGHYAYIGSGARGLRSLGEALTTFGQHLFTGQGGAFILVVAVTIGLGLRRPVALVVLPTMLFRFMANDTVYLGFHLQYGALLTGVAFLALIDGWAWLSEHGVRLARQLQMLQIAVLVVAAAAGVSRSSALVRVGYLTGRDAVIAQRAAVESLIPNGANVAADVYLVPQIVDRTSVQIAYASWKDETGQTIEADYVFLDLDTISYGNRQNQWPQTLIQQLTAPGGGYVEIAHTGRYVLLRRAGY